MKKSIFCWLIVLVLCGTGIYVSANTQEVISIDTLTVTESTTDADVLTVKATFTIPTNPEYITLMMLANDTGSASDTSEIIYIDQITNEGTSSVEFEVTKEKLKEALDTKDLSGATLSLKMGGSDIDFPSMETVTLEGFTTYEQGDVTGDGKVNTRDVTNLRRYLAGGYEDSISVVPEMCDVNDDGKENTRDVAALRTIIAG